MLDIKSSIHVRHHTVIRPISLKQFGEISASVLILYYILFDVSPKQHAQNQFPPLNFHQAPGSDLSSYHCRNVCFVLKSLILGSSLQRL